MGFARRSGALVSAGDAAEFFQLVPVAESVARIVELAERLDPGTPAEHARAGRSAEGGWAVWISGPPGSGTSALARRIGERLDAGGAGVCVLASDAVHAELLAERRAGPAERDTADRALAYGPKLLTEAGVHVLVDAPASRKASRQAARGMIAAFAEIQLAGPVAGGRRREGETDATVDDGESAEAELTVRTDAGDVERAAEQVLRVIQRLSATASGSRRSARGETGARA